MNWQHYGAVNYAGKIYHVWTAAHAEGYTAFQMNHSATQPPTGTGHYTNLEGLLSRFGRKVTVEQVQP